MANSILAALAALVATTTQTTATDPDVTGEPSLVAAIPREDRMLVDVLVNGQGPYDFMVDTGATRSVVSHRIAAALALPQGRAALLHDVVGSSSVQTVQVASLTAGRQAVAGVHAPVLSAEHMGSEGIFGLDGLRDSHLTLDFAGRRISVVPASSVRERPDADTVVVTARRRFGQLILADADIDGEPVYVIIDSGAVHSMANSALRKRLFRGKREKLLQPGKLISVTGRTMDADFALMPAMRIGGFQVGNIPIAFADVNTFKQFDLEEKPAMLMGMDLLRMFERVSLDFTRKKVRFTHRDLSQFRRRTDGRPSFSTVG